MISDVIIVAHNPGEVLVEAVASAVDQAGDQHVMIVDAETTDGSVDMVVDKFPEVRVIRTPNRGFAAACNRGMEADDGPLVLLLNPDAVLLPGALKALEAAAENDPGAGIVGALVLDRDGAVQASSYGRFPSLGSALTLRLWRAWQRVRGNIMLSPTTPPSTRRVHWVTGAAMLARRKAIAEVGPLDEQFFLYYEDIDWCWRMRASGWNVLLEPTARVIHHLGSSDAVRADVARAYRDSFYRYCDLRRLHGLKAAARIALAMRRLLGRV